MTSFDWYNEWTICLILFNKLFQLLPAFTYARAIGNLWSICLGVSILSLEWSKFEKTCTYIFYWKYFTFKSIGNSFSTIKKYIKAFKDIFFLLFFFLLLWFCSILKIWNYMYNYLLYKLNLLCLQFFLFI